MNIAEFAEERQVSPSAVYAHIRKNREKFNGHITKKGRNAFLDDYAIELLSKPYPVPAPIPVAVDYDSREKYTQALEEISRLQKRIIELEQEQAKAKATALLLAEKSSELEAEREKVTELTTEAERLRSRSLWQRIRNK